MLRELEENFEIYIDVLGEADWLALFQAPSMRVPVKEHYGTGRRATVDYADPLLRGAKTEMLM